MRAKGASRTTIEKFEYPSTPRSPGFQTGPWPSPRFSAKRYVMKASSTIIRQ